MVRSLHQCRLSMQDISYISSCKRNLPGTRLAFAPGMIRSDHECVEVAENALGIPTRSSIRRRVRLKCAGFRLHTLTVVPIDADVRRGAAADWSALLCAVGERKDLAAYSRLFEHFAPRLKWHLMQSGSAESQAEDLAQEAMVLVWRKAVLFDPAHAVASTWIFTIVRNLRVDLLRRPGGGERSGEMVDLDLIEDEEPPMEERLDAFKRCERLRAALTRLPLEQQKLLRLSYYDGVSHARIAAELRLPLGTIKSRVRLAIHHLRRVMES